jgi:[ribosomal protein S18]-alanine N-acetyltransferase
MSITGKLIQVLPNSEYWGEILEMDQLFFSRPWSRPQWEDADWTQHVLYSWKSYENPIGFALFFHLPDDPTAHLLKIYMDPTERGQGKSVLFWREVSASLLERGVKEVYLEVEEKNSRAVGFYQKIGFSKLRDLRSYYSDGSHALSMSLTL